MGRYTQRTRRGGGQQPASPPAAPVDLDTVDDNGDGTVTLNFSGTITYSGGGGLAGFDLNGGGLNSGTQTSPTTIVATPDQPFSNGDPWSLPTQPPEISETINVPASGFVS